MSRDIGRQAARDLDHQPEPAVARRVNELLDAHLAARTERDSGVVLERDAQAPVGAGFQRVGFEDNLPRLRGNQLVVADDEGRTRGDLDAPGRGRRLLPECRRGRHEYKCDDAGPRSRISHVTS